jgi:hypothetical protein
MKTLLTFFLLSLLIISTQSCGRTDLSGKPEEGEVSKLALPACKFNRVDIQSGSTITAYQSSSVPFGSVCSSEQRGCNSGVLGGSFEFATCTSEAAATCLFNGVSIAHGNTTAAFLESSVPAGFTCTQEIRSCDNGTLNGSYTFSSCSSL